MKNFIKLTKLTSTTCKEILINVSNIIFIEDDGEDRYIIFLGSGSRVYTRVKESLDEIEKLINEAQC